MNSGEKKLKITTTVGSLFCFFDFFCSRLRFEGTVVECMYYVSLLKNAQIKAESIKADINYLFIHEKRKTKVINK